jgi:preprotein translocase subunit SecF
MVIPAIMLVLGLSVLGYTYMTKGWIVERDIELSGGKLITINVAGAVDTAAVEARLETAGLEEYDVRFASGLGTGNLLIQVTADTDENAVIDTLKGVVDTKDYNVNLMGPALGDVFWKQTQLAIIFAFVFMAVVVAVIFRSFVPSFAVILSAFSDMALTAAVMDLLGIKLSLAILGALLMLVGYSIDTDILLTSRATKYANREEAIESAVKTGLTTTSTTIAALLVMLLITQAVVLKQIAMIIIIGLLIDIPNTWFMNAGIIRSWLMKKDKGAVNA